MAKVIFGNHSSVIVPRQDRESIQKFYCNVLGGTINCPSRSYSDISSEPHAAIRCRKKLRSIWLRANADAARKRSRLGDHLKAAIRYHFKTGHRETA
jgi:hypothetical protein